MLKFYRPRTSDRSGVEHALVQSGIFGTGGLALTASATTQLRVPTPFRRCWIERISLSSGGLVDGAGTELATVFKRDNVAGANVALTAATDLEVALQVANKVSRIPFLTTLTDGQRTLQEGDQIYVDIVSSGAITTQPTHSAFVFELLVLE